MRAVSLLLLGCLAAVAILASCGHAGGKRAPREGGSPSLTIFLLDGLTQTVFEEELAAGHLPEIESLLRRGAWIVDGVGAFPSMSGFAFYPFLTGFDAVESGVFGTRWFDRTRERGPLRNYGGRTGGLINEDLAAEPPLLFERFEGQPSFAVNTFLTRGATNARNLSWSYIMSKFRHVWWLPRMLGSIPFCGYRYAPEWADTEESVIVLALRDLERRPKVQWISLTSLDGIHHVYGMGERYRHALRRQDELIGVYRREAERLGLESERVYAIISDHGVADVALHIDLEAVLQQQGLSVKKARAAHLWTSRLTEPRSSYDDADALVAVNGNTMAYVYLRNPDGEGWSSAPGPARLRAYPGPEGPVDLPEVLAGVPGMELVAWRVDGGVEVMASPGRALLTMAAGRHACHVLEGADPFGYSDHGAASLCDGTPRSPRKWLAATHRSRFPYAVVRLNRLMEKAGPGDLVVTALEGYDFAPDFEPIISENRGGHGGLRADQLRVPYVLAGAGVRHGVRVETATAEDLGATLQVLLEGGRPSGAGRVLQEVLATDAP